MYLSVYPLSPGDFLKYFSGIIKIKIFIVGVKAEDSTEIVFETQHSNVSEINATRLDELPTV